MAYEYEVDGREYRGDRLTVVRFDASDPEPVRVALGSIQKGSRVKVHYDPENPARSVLLPGEGGRLSYSVIFGFVLLGAAFAAVVFDALRPEPRRLRRRRPIRGPAD